MVGQLMSKAAAMSPDASGPLRSMAMMRRRTGWDRALNRLFMGKAYLGNSLNTTRVRRGVLAFTAGAAYG
ncbi:hypothetical protein D3C73_1543240 [compost metagenome]